MPVENRVSARAGTGSNMQHVLVFDVDGTLTASRCAMDAGFADYFRQLVAAYPVYLVTGSDWGKLCEQVPADIREAVAGIFCCSGNELWYRGKPVFAMSHSFPDELSLVAMKLVGQSRFPLRTGRHVEARTGTLNVSVVGRNASIAERRSYVRHDQRNREREGMIAAIEASFPDYEAHRGGEISIDISPRGWNKGRVAKEIVSRHPGAQISFFGDRISDRGNDAPLARALRQIGGQHHVQEVREPSETFAILAERYPFGVTSHRKASHRKAGYRKAGAA
ncbi:MAG: HAD-IIB family hydrolase [Nitratireductor sp.]|nr:HAD-IIB family hydrolase [Nitratireductor sp.]